MVTMALELVRALAELVPLVLFASLERPTSLARIEAEFVLSPHRHELWNKLVWLPSVEAASQLDAMLYPYWPSPPRRHRGAPPALVMIHDLAYRLRPESVPWQQRLYLGTLVPAALRQADLILTPSRTSRDDLIALHPLPGLAERVHVIAPGRSGEDLAPGPLPPKIRPGFILAVGTLERRKNYLQLLSAHRLMTPRPQLVIVGRPGWGSDDLQRRLAADAEVVLLGHVDDAVLQTLYRSASLLAFPSLYEGFGLPLLEAMTQGLPAVVSSAGSLPEVAAGAALVVPPDQPQELARAMTSILSDPALAEELRLRGRTRALEFDWGRSARSLLELVQASVRTAPAREARLGG